ncbi:MAG: tyrosine-type recombinase/integrase [Caldilineaceae bacterium]
MNEIITVGNNAGDYHLIGRNTTDQMLLELWVGKSRRSGSANTQNTYRAIGEHFLDAVGKPVQAMVYADLATWANGLAGSINTRRTKINAVKSLFAFAYQLGYIARNPAVMLEAPRSEETKHRKMLSEEEIVKLVSADLNARDQAILRVLYSSGMRVSELINLRWQDVIPTGDRAILVIRGKGAKTRESGISPSAYKAMLNIKPAIVQPADFVFLSNRQRQMDRTTVNHLFSKLSEKLGKDISPHWFRHSHVSHALARGANPVDVQEQVGHSSLQVTTGYAHKTKNSSDYLII